MDIPSARAHREAFLSRIEEQFRELADEIGAPYCADAWAADGKAVLRVWREGEDDDALRVVAHFGDGGAVLEEKLSLSWEWQREVNEVLALGWKDSAPDAQAGLDSPADHAEGAYAIGKVTQGLRADVMAALKTQAASVSRLLPAVAGTGLQRSRCEPVCFAEASIDVVEPIEPVARGEWMPAAKRVAVQAVASRPGPDVGLLQSALGELATKGGLKAENVFAGFIKAAASPGALKQGDVAAYAQGALLELSFFYTVFLRSNGLRASDLGTEGRPLRDAVLKAKAAFFEHDEGVRWQVAREMVTGMRLYYAQALSSRGVPDGEAKEIIKSVFGREGAIANEAITIVGEPEPAKMGGRLGRFLRGKGME